MIPMRRSGAKAQVQISHKSFRNIGLIGRPDKSSVIETLCLIHDHILSLGLHPVFDTQTAQLVPYNNTQTVSLIYDFSFHESHLIMTAVY